MTPPAARPRACCIRRALQQFGGQETSEQIAGAVRHSVQLLDLADKHASFGDEHVGQFGRARWNARWNGSRRELRSSKDTGSGDRVFVRIARRRRTATRVRTGSASIRRRQEQACRARPPQPRRRCRGHPDHRRGSGHKRRRHSDLVRATARQRPAPRRRGPQRADSPKGWHRRCRASRWHQAPPSCLRATLAQEPCRRRAGAPDGSTARWSAAL